jgi:two-component system chemotaxis response regulator CheY
MRIPANAAARGKGPPAMRCRRILAVDVNGWLQLSIRNLFPRAQYDIKFVANSDNVAFTAISSGTDAVIIDIENSGSNNTEAIRRFRSLSSDAQSIVKVSEIPIFAICSTHNLDVAVRQAKSLRVSGWFAKPVIVRDLRNTIEEVLLRAPISGGTGIKTLLAVDCESRVRALYESIFSEMENCEIITVDSAIKALEHVEFKKPDLILTENNLPDMTGLELVGTLVEGKLGIPVVFVTSSHSQEFLNEATRLGVVKVVVKPFKVEQLKTLVDKVLMEGPRAGTQDAGTNDAGESEAREPELSAVLTDDSTPQP